MIERLVTLVIAILLLIVGFLAYGFMTGAEYVKVFEPTARDRLAAAAFQFNQDTPRDLGNGTRLDAVSVVGDGLIFEFTLLELSLAEIDPVEFEAVVYQASRDQFCRQPSLRETIVRNDAYVEARYTANDGLFITSIHIDKKSCGYDH